MVPPLPRRCLPCGPISCWLSPANPPSHLATSQPSETITERIAMDSYSAHACRNANRICSSTNLQSYPSAERRPHENRTELPHPGHTAKHPRPAASRPQLFSDILPIPRVKNQPLPNRPILNPAPFAPGPTQSHLPKGMNLPDKRPFYSPLIQSARHDPIWSQS